MDANGDKILIDGNTATALGCVYAGATVAAWYPITPSTSVMDAFTGFCEQYRSDPETGENNCVHHSGRRRTGRDRHGDRRVLERRARVHVDLGSRHFADERTAGAGLLRRDSGGDHGYPARRPVDRHADAHAAGRRARMRLRVARRHETYSAVPVESGGVFRVRGEELRSGGALPDAGVHAVRSRHRHERLGGSEADVGRFVSTGSRPCAGCGAARQDAEIPPLFARG